MLISIGVDIGTKNGALAIIDSNLNILQLINTPYYEVASKTKQNKPKLNKETGKYEKDFKKSTWTDSVKLGKIYTPYLKNNIIYSIEKVGARPGEGEMNSFRFGNSLGINQCIQNLLQPIQYNEFTPNYWKKELGVTSDKATSINLVNNIFEKPLLKFRGKLIKLNKSSNKEDDLAEALLLSFLGLKEHLENNGENN